MKSKCVESVNQWILFEWKKENIKWWMNEFFLDDALMMIIFDARTFFFSQTTTTTTNRESSRRRQNWKMNKTEMVNFIIAQAWCFWCFLLWFYGTIFFHFISFVFLRFEREMWTMNRELFDAGYTEQALVGWHNKIFWWHTHTIQT